MSPYRIALDGFRVKLVRGALRATSGNVTQAARNLGMSRRNLSLLMQRFGVRRAA